MRELFIEGNTLPEAYHNALFSLKNQGDIVGCSDYGQQQLECAMTVCVTKPLLEPRISRCLPGGQKDLQRYVMEMVDGILDFEVGHNWAYTYHQRYAYQLPYIISELKRNPESRRAVISTREFEVDSKCDDPACLQSIQYFIRNGKLDCIVVFRSNDLVKAFFFNAFALIELQSHIAAELGVEVGTYTHRSNSMHCYEKDFGTLQGYYNRILNSIIRYQSTDSEGLIYRYEGFYKDLMEEEKEDILKLVEDLKEKIKN